MSTQYPRYKREEKLSSKLSDNDVLECKRLRLEGISIKAIAEKYSLNSSTIYRAIMPNKEKKEHYKKAYSQSKKIQDKEAWLKSRKRKKEKQGVLYKKYYDEQNAIRKPIINEQQREWYKKHRKEQLEKNRQYYIDNKEKIHA